MSDLEENEEADGIWVVQSGYFRTLLRAGEVGTRETTAW